MFHKKHPLVFSSFLTQMLTNFNNSFTVAFQTNCRKPGIKFTTSP